MKTTAPALEVISNSYGSSFTYTRHAEKTNSKSHLWHYHPEIELVYVNGGAGKRQIGSHVSYYTNGDLILIGANLPHCGFTNEQTGNKNETVIHIKPEFLGNDFFGVPEMKKVQNVFGQAKAGIAFAGETKERIGKKIEMMEKQLPLERLLTLLSILDELESSEEYTVLNADGFSLELYTQDNDRINVIFNYVKDHFQEAIAIDEVSDLVSMTTPSFCRYFKKITNKTFTTFVNEYRLVHASKLLAEKPISINEVCYESGFNNFSHFSKLFKTYTGKSALQYRQELKTVIK
ncbi:AraC family transcriptional regulator [Flavobacterium hydatis]|jgi:AraC-like DNA-binding protein|uniref:AraC family transcriptional regulator n=1 Tax=Flavobacterium hydatis TaxID=991 RepID=A0A086AAZ2_FLAHY|nr:AraC family transcriptional regulator [Flavobacterium hydatis]KFF13856.1 AraC family transcriptional regulator [Flavobacterium hydatis]OXA84921.1 AraC family transcriptional regulator [Flavobacterium hydatis]